MANEFASIMEVFKLLPRDNCTRCGEKTCLVFATKVFQGVRALAECPLLPEEILKDYDHKPQKRVSGVEQDQQEVIAKLKDELLRLDFEVLAEKAGGQFKNGKLTIQVLGKPFSVDESGKFYSAIHVNPWIVLAVLGYLLNCDGIPLSGKWVPFRELPGARERNALFVKGAEVPLREIADAYPDFFQDMMVIFDGQEVENPIKPDIAMQLMPLPRLPFLICYWKPEEGMDSELQLFFDSTAVANSSVETIFGLAQGIVRMFEKIFITHGLKK